MFQPLIGRLSNGFHHLQIYFGKKRREFSAARVILFTLTRLTGNRHLFSVAPSKGTSLVH